MNQILLSLKSGNTGIVAAEYYLNSIRGCFGGGACPVEVFGAASAEQWAKALKDAEEKLTYHSPEMEVKDTARAGAALSKGSIMDFDAVITSTRKDRDRDVLLTAGARIDPKAPLLWQHMPMQPIGRMVGVVSHTDALMKGRFAIAGTALGNDAAYLVEMGALRISHGFEPDDGEYEPLDDGKGGRWLIKKFSIMEVSLVSVPSNIDAVVEAFDRGKLHTPLVKGWAKKHFDSRPLIVKGVGDLMPGSMIASANLVSLGAPKLSTSTQLVLDGSLEESEKSTCRCGGKGHEPEESPAEIPERQLPATDDATFITEYPVEKALRWNRSLSARFDQKAFDTNNEYLQASKLEYEWVAKHCGCQVKDIFKNSTLVPSARMGSFLTGVQQVTINDRVQDVRNITHDGKEEPPEYEVIQLNSKSSSDFLVEGIQFKIGPEGAYAVKFTPAWSGLYMTVYTSEKNRQKNRDVIEKSWEWAKANNFLKGEAFSLSGEFLPRDELSFEDVFLCEKNQQPIERMLKNMNEKKGKSANRGMVFMGPPGTGKTLSARVVKNNADASFIWISARDLYYMGAFSGISYAYDLAKELAPAVIVMEDIDNWFGDHTIDLLKTEMDGIGRSKGIVTILTTNFPERLPEALLDRPGRFHDVLKFDVPTEKERSRMLVKWLPDLSDEDRKSMVSETDGMSGAHVYELSEYAKTISEQDEIELGLAVKQALQKVSEQRELINQQWSQATVYRPRKELAEMFKKNFYTVSGIKNSSDDNAGMKGKKMKCPECGHSGKMSDFEDMGDDADEDDKNFSFSRIASVFLDRASKNRETAKRVIALAEKEIERAEFADLLNSL